MTKLLHYWIVRTKQYEGINTLYQFKTWISLIFLQSRGYEHGSIAVSTNLSFEKWLQIFGTPELTAALIDRFTHRCRIFTFEGKSARLSEAQRRKK